MNLKEKMLNLSWLSLVMFFILFFITCLALTESKVSAQTSGCANKQEVNKCLKALRDTCSSAVGDKASESCSNNVTKKFKDIVVSACKNKEKPAECSKKVLEKCKGKKGKDKTKCETDEAKKYPTPLNLGGTEGKYQCGKGPDQVKTRFNFGCIGNKSDRQIGAIEDLLWALARFLSYGVGLAIIASIIVSGIQYSTSEGNAEQTQKSKSRIQSAVIGLLVYIFAFSLLQYLVPGGIFRG